jgi:hypothetical protein
MSSRASGAAMRKFEVIEGTVRNPSGVDGRTAGKDKQAAAVRANGPLRGVARRLCLVGRKGSSPGLVFLDAAFSIGSIRHLETLLSTKLHSSATNDLSASSARAPTDRRCVLGLGAASISQQKFATSATYSTRLQLSKCHWP